MKIPPEGKLRELLAAAEAGGVPAQEIAWLAPLIDHTLLKTDVTPEQIQALCREAREFHFGAVCVRLNHVALAVNELEGTGVKVAAVVGFPTGAEATAAKVVETKEAIRLGAREIDMVQAVGLLRAGDLAAVFRDVQDVVKAAGSVPVKVILETCLLDQEEKILAAGIAKAAGAAFLKTSTGFSTGGATVEDVRLLRSVAKDHLGVKASGGVRSLADALRMVIAGANRLGTSSGVNILSGKSSPGGESRVY